jgi:hypothetical protein
MGEFGRATSPGNPARRAFFGRRFRCGSKTDLGPTPDRNMPPASANGRHADGLRTTAFAECYQRSAAKWSAGRLADESSKSVATLTALLAAESESVRLGAACSILELETRSASRDVSKWRCRQSATVLTYCARPHTITVLLGFSVALKPVGRNSSKPKQTVNKLPSSL